MTEDDALDLLRAPPPAPLGDALKARILARARIEAAEAAARAAAARQPRPRGWPFAARLALAASVAIAVAGGLALLASRLAPPPRPSPSGPPVVAHSGPAPAPAPQERLSPDLLALLGEHVALAGPFFRQVERLEGADSASDAHLVRAELEATELARRTCDLELKLHASVEPPPQQVVDYALTCRTLLGEVDTVVTDHDAFKALHFDLNAGALANEVQLKSLPALVRVSRVDAQIVGLNSTLQVEPRPVQVQFRTSLVRPDLVLFGNGRTLIFAGRAADANDCFASFATTYRDSPYNPYAVYWRDATANVVVTNGTFAIASDIQADGMAGGGNPILLPLAVPGAPEAPTSSGR